MAITKSDFEYITGKDGFTSVMPNNEQSLKVWQSNEALHSRLMPHEFTAFKSQARAAGYSVRKTRPVQSMDEILSELEML